MVHAKVEQFDTQLDLDEDEDWEQSTDWSSDTSSHVSDEEDITDLEISEESADEQEVESL